MVLKETASPEPKDMEVNKEIPLGFDPKTTSNPISEKQDPKESQPPSARDPKETQKMGVESQALIDSIMLTPLSSRGTKHKAQEEVIPLSEYKFDHNRLAMLKRTPKRKRALIRGIEKVVIEGFGESTLWYVLYPEVARISIETSLVIVGWPLQDSHPQRLWPKKLPDLNNRLLKLKTR